MNQKHTPLKAYVRKLTMGMLSGILLLALFIDMAIIFAKQGLTPFDEIIVYFLRSFASDSLTTLAIGITHMGSATVEISLTILIGSYLLFRLKHHWEALTLAISLTGAWLLNSALKLFFHRARPQLPAWVAYSGYSFPSGHAMISTVFYGMLGYLLYLNQRDLGRPRWVVLPLTLLLIFSIGLSRVYLGAHYASDVLAGFAAGGAFLAACITALNTIRYYKSDKDGETSP